MKRTVTFGEVMIRLVPPDFKRLEQTETLNMSAGGSEFNVAVDLARLGGEASWVSILPDDPLGRFARNKAREHGVDTSHVMFSRKGRMGKYFVEFGASPRASKVFYDRTGSSVSLMEESIDWKGALKNAGWFHTSGITPALSSRCAEETQKAIETAKQMKCTVSYDLNYRKKLWSPKEARETTQKFVDKIDFCTGNEEDFQKVLGIDLEGDNSQGNESYDTINIDYYINLAQKVKKVYGFSHVAISLRDTLSVQRNNWKGLLYTGGVAYISRSYELELIDRVGGGDSFSAGLIHSLQKGSSPQDTVEFAAAFSALKHTIVGDLNFVSEDEVRALLKSGSSRIER